MHKAFLPALAFCLAVTGAFAKGSQPSDEEIAKTLIAQSIAAYPGTCACPYQAARNGSACGRRSAYSKPNGYAPLCYRKDVTDEDIARYRGRLNN